MLEAELTVYFIVAVIICVVSVLCHYYCRQTCRNSCFSDNNCDSSNRCSYGYSLAIPRHARAGVTNTWRPVPQQPQQDASFTNFGDFSREQRDIDRPSFFTRTYFTNTQNAATISSAENSTTQTSVVPSAPQLYNVTTSPSAAQPFNISIAPSVPQMNNSAIAPSVPQMNNSSITPSAPQLHNIPSESLRINMPAPISLVVVDDQPPDYAAVVLADLSKGREHTQYPRVIQKE